MVMMLAWRQENRADQPADDEEQRPAPAPAPGPAGRRDGGAADRRRRTAIRDTRLVCSSRSNSLDRGDERVVAPSRLVFRHHGAVPHHQHPVAGAQVLELAADDEDRLALPAHRARRRRAAPPSTSRRRRRSGPSAPGPRVVGQRPAHRPPSAGCRRRGSKPADPGPR